MTQGNFEIKKTANGYLLFPDGKKELEDALVFEQIEAALSFIKFKLEKNEPPCGSCSGTGRLR